MMDLSWIVLPVVSPLLCAGSFAYLPRRSLTLTISTRDQSAKRGASRSRSLTSNNKTKKIAKKTQTTPWYTYFSKGDERYDQYMASEWGFEKRGDIPLFEKLSLEGAQSGLSWRTILNKREHYRKWFKGFDIDLVAGMSNDDVDKMLASEATNSVVRHGGNIEYVINNAQCIQTMRREAEEQGNNSSLVFDKFIWSFVNDKPILNRWDGDFANALTFSDESVAMSRALKQRGFKFVGPTTCYSLMESCGLVIAHPHDSPEWKSAFERLKLRQGGFQEPC